MSSRHETDVDYAQTGLDIRRAMLDIYHKYPNKRERPEFILWDGYMVKTSDKIRVPRGGSIEATFLSASIEIKQGFDMEADGWFLLEGGERVPLLRTWKEERCEDRVRYPYFSESGHIWFWNVYKRLWPDGSYTDEKWTGNAGFWIEEIGPSSRIYHCSHGTLEVPNFESLLVKIEVTREQ